MQTPKISKRPIKKLIKRPITKPYSLNKKTPTTFAHQDRMALFAPFTKMDSKYFATKKNPITVLTTFGKVVYEYGMLDQTHRDILQVLLSHPQEFGYLEDPNNENFSKPILFKFRAYKLAKFLHKPNATKEWLVKKLKEMKLYSFTLVPDRNSKLREHFKFGEIFTSVLDFVSHNPKTEGSDHDLIEIGVQPRFLQCYLYDTAIHTEKLTEEILQIKEGFIKALVHHCLTHQVVKRDLENLMKDIGLPTKEENQYKFCHYKNAITQPENLEMLKTIFKIEIKQNTITKRWLVTYHQQALNAQVWADNEFNQYSRMLEHGR